MKAVVWHDVGKLSVDEVPDPVIRDAADVPGLLSKIASGAVDSSAVWTKQETMPTAIDAYEAFDRREPGWTKVIIETGG